MFVISGPGGVGKSTIATQLARRDRSLWLSTSWTTRPQRPGETGDEYVFVDRDAFNAKIESNEFLEWAEFAGNLYGTPIPDLPQSVDLLLEIDIQGARQVRQRDVGAIVILIVAPSWDSTENRLRTRGDSEASIEQRLEIGRREEAEGRKFADYVVVNDDLDATLANLEGIIAAHRIKE